MCQGSLNNLIVLQFIRFQEFGQYCYFFYCEVEFVLLFNILDIENSFLFKIINI